MIGPFLVLGLSSGTGPTIGPASGTTGSELNWDSIIKLSFDSTSGAIRVVDAGAPSAYSDTDINYQSIWQKIYDPIKKAIRVVQV